MDDEVDSERLHAAIEELRRLPEPDPIARDRLRQALARERRRRGRALPGWRRALLAATVLFAFGALLLWSVRSRTAASAAMPVQFVLVAEEAHTVALAGDFNGWDVGATPLVRGDGGVWSVVVRLAPGAFNYSFVVDGAEWRGDPAAATATDDFGRPSSLIYVTPEI